MRALRRLAPLLVALACGPQAPPAEVFWDWFAGDARRLSWARTDRRSPLADEIAERLARVEPGLVFEVSGEPGAERELVVSADGRAELFPAVEALVAAAPPLPGWSVRAFRPRLAGVYSIEYRGFLLDPDELWFAASPGADGRVGLRLYAPGIGGPRHRLAVEAVRLLVHAAVGEREALTRIGEVEHRELRPDPAAAGLLPIAELARVVDAAAPHPEGP